MKYLEGLYYCFELYYVNILRFYQDRYVIGESVILEDASKIDRLNEILDRRGDLHFRSTGYYTLLDEYLLFDLKSQSGIVKYNGITKHNGQLMLYVSSLINDFNTFHRYKPIEPNGNNYYLDYDKFIEKSKGLIRAESALNFPETCTCGLLLNKFLEHTSEYSIENGLKSFQFSVHAKSIEKITVSNARNVTKYVFSKDIWGVKELLVVSEGDKEWDTIFSFVSRGKSDYNILLGFLKSHKSFCEVEDTGLRWIFECTNPSVFWPNVSKMLFVLDKQHSQKHDLSVLLDFH